MIEYLKQNPSVIYVTESVGFGDLEFEINVRNSAELHEHINKLRVEFGELIKEYEICMNYSQEQVNYLPGKNT